MKNFKKYLLIGIGLYTLNFNQLPCAQPQMPPQIPTPPPAPQVQPTPVAQPTTPPNITQPAAQPKTAPLTMPIPQPTTPPPAAPVAPATTPIQTSAAATQSSKNVIASEKEFDEIYKQLDQLNALKKDLKTQLSDAEDKLNNARKIALDSKKISFEIFQKNSVSDAELSVAQVDKNLQELKNLQKTLKEAAIPKFENDIKKIDDLSKVIQNKITELQTKGLKFQISQAQLDLQKQQDQKTVTEQGKPGTQEPVKSKIEQSIWQKSYNTIIDLTAIGIKKIKKTWSNFKNWVYSQKQEPDSEGKKNFKSIETQSQPQLILTSEAALKSIISEIDGLIKQFDEVQISLNQKYLEMKLKIKTLDNTIKSNAEIKKYFEKMEEENPSWKNSIVNGFSTLIDFAYISGKAVVKISKSIYSKTIAPMINDIKTKINEEDKEKTPKNATATATPTSTPINAPTATPAATGIKPNEPAKEQVPLMPVG